MRSAYDAWGHCETGCTAKCLLSRGWLSPGFAQFPPLKHEGWRRASRRVGWLGRDPLRRRRRSQVASPLGAPPRRFWAGGPCFRDSFRRDFPAFPCPRPADKERQNPVVGPDGDLQPPGCAGIRPPPARRRRLPPHSRRLMKRPSWTGR